MSIVRQPAKQHMCDGIALMVMMGSHLLYGHPAELRFQFVTRVRISRNERGKNKYRIHNKTYWQSRDCV